MTTPERNACLNLLARDKIVTGRKARTENGHPRITPVAATATAAAGFSKRKSADERDIAYMENELGKKPVCQTAVTIKRKNMMKIEPASPKLSSGLKVSKYLHQTSQITHNKNMMNVKTKIKYF